MMTTALLPAIHRKYPENTIHWITKKNAMPVLEYNPFLFKVWEWHDESRLILREMTFDLILNGDKNQNSAALTNQLRSNEKLGFGLDDNGIVVPLNAEAEYNYRMGLDDELKFQKNQKTGLDILAETWRLNFQQDEYILVLTEAEKAFCQAYRKQLGIPQQSFVLGFNTGCSTLFPNKKMTIDQHVNLIQRMKKSYPDMTILLLGGKEDTERNQAIKKRTGEAAIETPTTEGLRKGILYENSCDCVVTGDSLGLHIAIALKKQVVVWFGVSCGVEIELYDRGEKIFSDLDCSPCWKSDCDDPKCIDQLDLNRIFKAVEKRYKVFNQK